jgi:hypothetical protein
MHREKTEAATPVERLEQLVETAVAVARTAKRNRANLGGLNFYADRLAKLRTDATVAFSALADPPVGDISAVAEMMQLVFAPNTKVKKRAGPKATPRLLSSPPPPGSNHAKHPNCSTGTAPTFSSIFSASGIKPPTSSNLNGV